MFAFALIVEDNDIEYALSHKLLIFKLGLVHEAVTSKSLITYRAAVKW
jgi:hypothetical protein